MQLDYQYDTPMRNLRKSWTENPLVLNSIQTATRRRTITYLMVFTGR